MKEQRTLVLLLGIAAALFVVGVLWYVSGARGAARRGTVPVTAVDTASVSRQAALEPMGTPRRAPARKTPRTGPIVQRYDECRGER